MQMRGKCGANAGQMRGKCVCKCGANAGQMRLQMRGKCVCKCAGRPPARILMAYRKSLPTGRARSGRLAAPQTVATHTVEKLVFDVRICWHVLRESGGERVEPGWISAIRGTHAHGRARVLAWSIECTQSGGFEIHFGFKGIRNKCCTPIFSGSHAVVAIFSCSRIATSVAPTSSAACARSPSPAAACSESSPCTAVAALQHHNERHQSLAE